MLKPAIKLNFLSFFIVLSYSFNSSVYISLPVMEREVNLKYALNVMGCKTLPYWAGTFNFDLHAYFVVSLGFWISALIG